MFDNPIQLSQLTPSQLKTIISEGMDEENTAVLLCETSGELVMLWPEFTDAPSTPLATRCKGIEQAHHSALAALNGTVGTSDKRCLTEIIRHRGQIYGALTCWIDSRNVDSQVVSDLERRLMLTRRRIEDLLRVQEETDQLSAKLIDDYRELGAIYKLSTQLAGVVDVDQVYHLVLEQALEVIKANWGCIFKRDTRCDTLRMVQSYPETIRDQIQSHKMLDNELVNYVAQTGHSILIEDVKHPLWKLASGARFAPPLMSCPLQIGQSVLGVIVVTRESGMPIFDSGDLKILESIALQSAAAMKNVTLLEDLSRSNHALHQEIRERRQAETAMKASEKRFRKLFEHSNDAILILASDGQILDVNSRANELLNCDINWIRSMSFFSLLTPEQITSGQAALQVVNQSGSVRFESQFKKADGKVIDVEISSRVIDEGKRIVQAIVRDITERKRMEAQLRHSALHDALTELPNRTLFLNRLEQSIERQKRYEDDSYAVLFLDLDHFKVINDSLGHAAGDQLLIEFAHRLKECLRPNDTIARLGGDEFTILIDGHLRGYDEVITVAERIRQSLATPFSINGHQMVTTASIGIVLGDTNYDCPEDILRDADAAMYRAKVHRNHYEVFNEGMRDKVMARLELEMNLRLALEREEFEIYYQPLMSLEKNQITGFEALLRWDHPELGTISPGTFIPLAEETGLIIPIGSWVLRRACEQIRIWQKQFPFESPLKINVNLSAKQFTQSDLIQQIDQILQETSLDPQCLNLEITESLIMEDTQSTATMLAKLKALNVNLHMDDFGTGYSSLSYLHRLPIDTLKIDRSFVSNMETDTENFEIVRAIVALTHTLGIEVTAEGIENTEQLDQLKKLSCQRGQGFFFSKPMDPISAEMFLTSMSDIA